MFNHRQGIIFMFVLAISAGCTSVSVKPVDRDAYPIASICIEENKAVNHSGFLPMLENNLSQHSIQSQRYSGLIPSGCDYTLHYVANWAWDLAAYLRDADISVRKGSDIIGNGNFHLRGGGGFALTKFDSAESKINPVLDKVFVQFPKTSNGAE